MNKTHKDKLNSLTCGWPPFNPFLIAEGLGLAIDKKVSIKQVGYAGSLTNKDGNIYLWVNPFDEEGRRNFTAAHLLGRYLQGDLDNQDILVVAPDGIYK